MGFMRALAIGVAASSLNAANAANQHNNKKVLDEVDVFQPHVGRKVLTFDPNPHGCWDDCRQSGQWGWHCTKYQDGQSSWQDHQDCLNQANSGGGSDSGDSDLAKDDVVDTDKEENADAQGPADMDSEDYLDSNMDGEDGDMGGDNGADGLDNVDLNSETDSGGSNGDEMPTSAPAPAPDGDEAGITNMPGSSGNSESDAAPSGDSGGSCSEALVKAMVDVTNEKRAAEGKSALTCNEGGSKASEIWSKKMCSVGSLSHDLEANSAAAGFGAAGENVLQNNGLDTTVDVGIDQWMNSPGHYQNIMGDYSEIGCGWSACAERDPQVYWTCVYGNPA